MRYEELLFWQRQVYDRYNSKLEKVSFSLVSHKQSTAKQQSGMDAAQLHIYIKGYMIVIDGTYHIVNRGATLSSKGSKVHI